MAYPNPVNLTSITKISAYSVNTSGGYLGMLLNIALFTSIIIYLLYEGNDFGDSAIVSSLLTLIQAAVLFGLGVSVSFELVLIVIILVISVVLKYYSKNT